MGNPKFTVLIPAYNVAPYIDACLRSVLQQTYADFEIVVVDDASTDETRRVVQSFSDERIRLLVNRINRGVSFTRNFGISESAGDYVVLLDSDDTIARKRLEILNQAIERKNPDLIFDDLLYLPEGKSAHGISAYGQRKILPADAQHLDFNDFIGKDLGILQGTFRRSFVKDHGIEFDERFRIGEDFVFYAEMFLLGAQAEFLEEAMYMYRQGHDSLIGAGYAGYCSDMVDTSTYLLVKYEGKLSRIPQTRSLLEKRLGKQTIALNEQLAKNSLRTGDVGAALTRIAKDPRIGIRLAKKGLGKFKSSISW